MGEGGIHETHHLWRELDIGSLDGSSSCSSSCSCGGGGCGSDCPGGDGRGSSCVAERDADSVRDDGGFSSDEDAAAIPTPGSGTRSPVLLPSGYMSFPDASGFEAGRRH